VVGGSHQTLQELPWPFKLNYRTGIDKNWVFEPTYVGMGTLDFC